MNGASYYIPSLPFAWSFSPIIAIETLARHLVLRHPRQVILIQYLDDVLLISTDRELLASQARGLASDLVSMGGKVSPKSDIVPKSSITWLGKIISGSDYSMAQAPRLPGAAT